MKLKISPTISSFLITILFALLSLSCGDEQETVESRAVPKHSDSFTFFDIGKNSILSSNLRRDLSKVLGDDSTEPRSILDLEINYRGFLKRYFPELDKLNQDLNFPPGERVEHRTVKLMYRYPRKKNSSFNYVELVFSEYTQTPVLIRIHFKKDDQNTIETLKEKYGPPEVINWSEESGKSLYWRKNGDLLILSFVQDQFGNPTYQIGIYFTKELEELLRVERTEKQKTRQERTKSGKTAF